MKPWEVLKKVGNAVGTAGKDVLRARETRARSPAFKAEMARENAEFLDILNGLGKNTFDAGVGLVLNAPYRIFVNQLKFFHDKKYGGKNYLEDSFKLFFWKNGVAHNVLKVTANALHLGAKGAKIGVRQLFKL